MATGQCKWCGKTVDVSILMRFGGYCSPACYAAGRQHERIFLGIKKKEETQNKAD